MLILVCPKCGAENPRLWANGLLIGNHQVVVIDKNYQQQCSKCRAVFEAGVKLNYRVEKEQ